MQVVLSKVLGFCSGVRRAVESAQDALDLYKGSGKKIYSFGPLIHNQAALERLQEGGLLILEENQIHSLNCDCVVIVRAHGIPPALMARIRDTGAVVVDSTCPRVSLSQRRAMEAARNGAAVFLAGDRGHAEVKAIEGCAGKDFFLVQNAEEAFSLFEEKKSMVSQRVESCGSAILLSQTTFSPDEFKKISSFLLEKIPFIQVFDTICPATLGHQKALLDLAKNVDAIVVVGGKKSANSKRLYESALSVCPKTFFVEGPDDLPDNVFTEGVVGLTAGASTPDFVIESVAKRLSFF